MNIYKDTMPPVYVALRFTLIAFIGTLIIISLNIFSSDLIKKNTAALEEKINREFFPGANNFKIIPVSKTGNKNYYYESYDINNSLSGYIFYTECNDYGESLRIAAAVNADLTVKNIKVIDNYRIIGSISNLNDFFNYVEKIKGKGLNSITDFKSGLVFNTNKIFDYKNQVAFNAVIDCLAGINELMKKNNDNGTKNE